MLMGMSETNNPQTSLQKNIAENQ